MPNRSLKALYMELPLFACTCHTAMARCVGTVPPLGNVSPSISCFLWLSWEEKGKKWTQEREWQRTTWKGQIQGEIKGQRKAKDKGKYDGDMQGEWQRSRLLHSSTIVWSTREEKKRRKELGYWIFSLIRENTMSFVINQAETFNYKTNYEVVNVSHLTQPSPKQNRTFSGE